MRLNIRGLIVAAALSAAFLLTVGSLKAQTLVSETIGSQDVTARAVGYPAARAVGGRPAHCPPRLWCGCWLGAHLGKYDRSLWLATAWARVGTAASGPAPGVVVVWRHHVGIVRGVIDHKTILLLSGNDGNAVRERPISIRGVIAWRWV